MLAVLVNNQTVVSGTGTPVTVTLDPCVLEFIGGSLTITTDTGTTVVLDPCILQFVGGELSTVSQIGTGGGGRRDGGHLMLKQSTAFNRVIRMIDSADHISGKTGASLTVSLSKAGGAFSVIVPTVTELVVGFYNLAFTSGHTDTLGSFTVQVTASGADLTEVFDQVVLDLPGATVTSVTDRTGYRLSSTGVDDVLRTALPESYATDGAAGTLTQMLYMIQQLMAEKAIVSTTMTVKKLDGTATAATFTLNSATTPTTITRAT